MKTSRTLLLCLAASVAAHRRLAPCRSLLLCLAACLAASAVAAEPYVEKAQARTTPWSGYWWPLSAGGLVRPLGQYDAATGQAAVAWEQAHRQMGSGVPGWFGFCHAWAASSIMEPEPERARTARRRDGGSLGLAVGDQKGMLAACHTNDVANSYGERFEEGESDASRQDIAPDALWRILKLYLGQQQVPVVLDLDAGPQVWNFPAYAYQLRTDGTADGDHQADLTVWLVDDGVPPDHVGTRVRRQTYTFGYTMRSGAVVMGSGRWTGRSRQDHPDFVWYPYLARADNPEVRQAAVRQLLGQASTPTTAPPPTTPTPPTPPTPPTTPTTPTTPVLDPPPGGATGPPPLPGPDDPDGRPVLTPVELAALVANRTSAFALDVTVDRFDGATYQAGEPIAVRVNSEQAGYLYLFYLDNQGQLALLYPPPGHPGRIDAGTPTNLPGANDAFAFRVGNSPGLHCIKAVVTARPILLGGLVVGQQQQQARHSAQQATRGAPKRPGPAAVRPAQAGQAPPSRSAVVEQTFRWPPAQQDQVQAILRPYAAQNGPQVVEGADPRQTVGRFAQDEVRFVVQPAAPAVKPQQQAAPPRNPK